MSELATQTLQVAAREISVALGEARAALEAHVEQSDNLALLERCASEVHQVQGALRLLEIYGAALLAEEMEQVARYLIGSHGERKNQTESLDALMRAMVQLPGYLERVLAGGRDMALVLLPLLNDLRAVRGSALLSEGTLLLLNLKSDRQAQPTAPAPGEAPLSPAQWARRLRSRFQAGLVGWIRGERLEQNLEILATVATRLEQVATQQCVFQLWWVTGALLEALRENGVESNVSIKRLLGLADREIRRLYELGEARYAQNPPVELLNNLLYYIARSTSAGPRVAAVRASFRLAELLPVDESVEQERENLSAPSVKLMHTVAAAIREDLTRVKDVLDIFVRRGGGQAEELTPQIELLRKIGDTLGVLGLGELRANVQEANARLEGVVAGRESADEATLVQVAATLIRVEDRLDDQLVGLILPRKIPLEGVSEEHDQDFEQVQSAVLRECVVNLARVKESVAQNVGGTLDAAGLDSWAELMRGIQAGLLMLGKSRAVEIVNGVNGQLRRVMQPGGMPLSGAYLDRLADAIVSLEYYIETLQAGRSDPWYMLDNAQLCLEVLEREPERIVPTVAPMSAVDYARTVRLGPPPEAHGPGPVDLSGTGRLPAPPVLAAAPAGAVASEPADPELLHLFAEEAQEELEKIRLQFPVWDQNPLEVDALANVRRSYHTLKGSGRMVGARELADCAWAMENLLNRLLEGTLGRSAEVLDTLRAAVAVLPALVADLSSDSPVRSNAAQLVARAHALAAGRELPKATGETAALPTPISSLAPEQVLAAGAAMDSPGAAPAPYAATLRLTPDEAAAIAAAGRPGLQPPPPVAAAAATGSDDDSALREIYARETSSHVATVRRWLAREQPHPAPHVLIEEVYRACHTLSGSSKMAEARHGIRLAEPLNHWLRKSFDSGVGLDDSDLLLLTDCMTAMETVAGHLDEETGYFVVHDTLRARVARAELELDRRIAESNEQSVRTGVHALPVMPEPPSVASASAVAADVLSAPALSIDYDPEVAAIFCEEASELLESSQSALQIWNSAHGSTEHLAALKRSLHTFKGGARMAGIAAMGDLAHELESLIIQISLGTASGDERARAIAQDAVDELARMREQVSAGRPVPQAQALIGRIQAIARGAEAELALPAAATVAPAPVILAPPTPPTPPTPTPTPLPLPLPPEVLPAIATPMVPTPVVPDDFDIVIDGARPTLPAGVAPAVPAALAAPLAPPALAPAPVSPFELPAPALVPPGRE
ncbi:MAG: Hpt domain-containing protein, partial [Steroidobacteraceae bacterium]